MCAIKKRHSFGDASHAYVKLLYARERVEMQAGRETWEQAQQTLAIYRVLNISFLSIISVILQNVATATLYFLLESQIPIGRILQPVRKLIETEEPFNFQSRN